MALKKVSVLSPQEFRFLVESGFEWPWQEEVELDIRKSFYLDAPEIDIFKSDEGFSAQYSPLFNVRILKYIERRKKGPHDRPLENTFYQILRRQDSRKIQKNQVAIMDWVARQQGKYLMTGDPDNLKEIHEADVCNGLTGYGLNTRKVSKLLTNLSVRLPDRPFEGRVTFAKELVPGCRIGSYRHRLESYI